MISRKIINDRITPRLFSNVLMEKLSHVHPLVPVFIFLPVISIFLSIGLLADSISLLLVVALFFGGVLFWTITEYVIHRYAFHYETKSKLGKQVHFLVHGIHHDYPQDPLRLVMPPIVSIPLAMIFYVIFVNLIGQIYSSPFFAGFVFGYLAYDMIHYAIHHFSLKNISMGLWLRKYHSRHHYQNEHCGFGVSSPLWDYVLGTMPPKSQSTSQ